MAILQKVQNAFKKDKETDAATTSPESASTVFDDKKVTVIYVLGGPGAGRLNVSPVRDRCTANIIHDRLGKGTQCALLVKDYDFVHLSGACVLSPTSGFSII
jgi:UMP-CMP kinase